MFCEKCGAQLKTEDRFCPECGNPVQYNFTVPENNEETQNFSEDIDTTETDIFNWDDQSYKVPDPSADDGNEKKTIKWIAAISISVVFFFVIAVIIWSVTKKNLISDEYGIQVQTEKRSDSVKKDERSTDMLTPKATSMPSSTPIPTKIPQLTQPEVQIPVQESDTVYQTEFLEKIQPAAAETENLTEEDYIFPQSSSVYLTEAQLEGLTKEELLYARNEIYARYGRKFIDANIQAYFNGKSWYVPAYEAEEFDAQQDNIFNDYEKKNVELILKYEKSKGYI